MGPGTQDIRQKEQLKGFTMKILVSGAGIGGSAATLLLRASGHDVVAIDKAPSFSRRGYILSLKYFGLGIMKSLGLYEKLQRSASHFGSFRFAMPKVVC